ncbi:putative major facilitator superfamily (MFS) transporter [Streptomyces himastatinicus ATCC 53653]|uniref:Putative major facilitator superfamily (MFS) transporter n=1 Tax=Streptomyces himastatinicus ATCC 53653 TaxID=457427 RepID=D9WWG0_9ACTN|nr:MFS transporter [Streptomyces himastatinicus]EFL26616.1 putative major facilitator superfamily (MFS) transporter [Streptomyces himastatinicus ATCC 53653]
MADQQVVSERAVRAERAVRTTVLLVVVLTAGAYLPSPLYPDYQRLFGYDDLVMTLLFATFALVSGPALLLCGPAADLVGDRPVLRLSVLLAAAGSCCFLFADSPFWLFTGRVGHALALGAATGAAQALIARHRGPTARVAGPLLAGLAFAAGTALGPVASGVLAEYVPGMLTTPYVLHLALLGWVWHRLRRTVPATTGAERVRQRWRPTRPHIPPALRALFLVAGLTGFLAWAVVGIYLALLPALLEQTPHGDHPALTGGVLGSVLVWSLLAQLAGARRTAYAAQRYGLAALAGSLVLLASTGAASLPATLGSTVLAGLGHGLAYSGAARAVDARTPPGQRAGIGAALYLLFYWGSGAPAVAVGLATAWMPLTAAVTWLSWAGVALTALALTATFLVGALPHAAAHPTAASDIDHQILQRR